MPYDPRLRRQDSSWVPDYDPSGRQDASGENTPAPPAPGGSSGGGGEGGGGASDFWSKIMAAISPYTSQDTIGKLAANKSKLDPLIAAGASAFGGEEGILKGLAYNPLKGLYTMLSYLEGTPYYDKGNAADGSETWKPFYVPGFDYDPSQPGVQGPSWINNPYDPSGHYFRT